MYHRKAGEAQSITTGPEDMTEKIVFVQNTETGATFRETNI